jgi:tRNA-specific 2-thiouridylase
VDRRVTVGPVEMLDVVDLVATRARWCGPAPDGDLSCWAQVRAHGDAVPATARHVDGEVRVRLHEPQRGVAPGQAVVLYAGTRVLGSATIARTASAAAAAAAAAFGPAGPPA